MWRWLIGRGGLRLSVSGGLGHALRAAGRWWAGHWILSGTGEIPLGTDGERGPVSRQCPLHKGGEIRSRAILGRRRSVRDVQAGIVERTERVVRVAGEVGEDQKLRVWCDPRAISPPAPAGGGGIPGEGGDPWGTMEKKDTERKTRNKTEGRRSGYCFGRSFCHVRWSKERGDVEYTKTRGFNPTG